jgi:hypothetical protein
MRRRRELTAPQREEFRIRPASICLIKAIDNVARPSGPGVGQIYTEIAVERCIALPEWRASQNRTANYYAIDISR